MSRSLEASIPSNGLLEAPVENCIGRPVHPRMDVWSTRITPLTIAPSTEPAVCRIIWRGEAKEVITGESMIGRDPGCAVYIEADSVSRRHAKLSVCDGVASIEDLGSQNGTWISGERIQGIVNLADGSSIRLGSENIRFEFLALDRPTKTVTRP